MECIQPTLPYPTLPCPAKVEGQGRARLRDIAQLLPPKSTPTEPHEALVSPPPHRQHRPTYHSSALYPHPRHPPQRAQVERYATAGTMKTTTAMPTNVPAMQGSPSQPFSVSQQPRSQHCKTRGDRTVPGDCGGWRVGRLEGLTAALEQVSVQRVSLDWQMMDDSTPEKCGWRVHPRTGLMEEWNRILVGSVMGTGRSGMVCERTASPSPVRQEMPSYLSQYSMGMLLDDGGDQQTTSTQASEALLPLHSSASTTPLVRTHISPCDNPSMPPGLGSGLCVANVGSQDLGLIPVLHDEGDVVARFLSSQVVRSFNLGIWNGCIGWAVQHARRNNCPFLRHEIAP
ncbi:hypothetical protein OPT61_g10187 [Boeremia exigua]|uniref:Uncharacterized protein n=1 Tax=Boeremia exigua TaxID=749465 RepID=A0ACC2HRT0_9PLEO|nr:hypothetical protein OPT61_g10187 [Boeremia exigua]